MRTWAGVLLPRNFSESAGIAVRHRLVAVRRTVLPCCVLAIAGLGASGYAQDLSSKPPDPIPSTESSTVPWLDRTQGGLYRLMWRTARSLDRLGGQPASEDMYKEASGYLSVAMMWSEYDGWDPRVRFNADLPLPRLNRRFSAFVGRVNRDEYVSERDVRSGAFPGFSRSLDEDQTLAGIAYAQTPEEGGRFSASGGVRLSGGLDPYVKASYIHEWLAWNDTIFRFKETLFWQRSERIGLTTRVDFDRFLGDRWHVRWTGSGTVSQETQGIRGYSTLTFTRALADRQAMVFRASFDGNTTKEVRLREFEVIAAYRRSILRDWLVMEVRTSVAWPKEAAGEPREPSLGVGIGLQMYFGNEEFTAKPITF